MAYDIKFREQVLKFIDNGYTIKEAHELFGVGTTTIKGWKKLRKETGKLEKRPLKRNHKKICPKLLKVYITQNPDSYLIEIADIFNCSPQAVYSALKRLNLRRKKND